MDTQDTIIRAFTILTMAYPSASLSAVNYAVSTEWNNKASDEDNIKACQFLQYM